MIFCIDSDGCVFDNMRSKHELAFLPAFIEIWSLEQWRPIVENHWYHINLYSRSRGINRFAAFTDCLRRLHALPDTELHQRLPKDLTAFEAFIANPANRNVDAIQAQLEPLKHSDCFIRALEWSRLVNQRVAAVNTPHKPFTQALSTLARMAAIGEVHVVSQAPNATLLSEWAHAAIAPFTTRILGQEYGSKSDQVFLARNKLDLPTLLVGDAPGDELAAKAAGVAFFPIIPQRENASWEQLNVILLEVEKYRSIENHPQHASAMADFHEALAD